MNKFTINIAPVTKKNSQQIYFNKATGKPFVTPSKQYKEYENSAGYFIPRLHIDYPVNVQAVFYMKTHRKCDLVNLQEALLDVMVKYECIKDDNFSVVASMNGSKVCCDKENPRTEVVITEIGENI